MLTGCVGWSLGGTLSVKISRILADDPNPPFTVSGLLIIDTPKHGPYSQLPEPLMDPDPSKLPKLIQQSFANVDTYLEDWQLPDWNAATNNGEPMTARAAGKKYEVGPSKKLHLPVEGDWVVRETEPFKFEGEKPEKPLGPPPAVLIRGALYSKPPRETEQKCTIDRYRDEPMLGWDGRYPDFILASLDVDSAHYDLFDKMDEKKVIPSAPLFILPAQVTNMSLLAEPCRQPHQDFARRSRLHRGGVLKRIISNVRREKGGLFYGSVYTASDVGYCSNKNFWDVKNPRFRWKPCSFF